MNEQPPKVEPTSYTGSGSPPGMPRWVKIAAVTVGVLVLLFLILQVTGIAGQHGPGRHMSGSASQPVSFDSWTSAVGTVA